ncbi:prolyl-tRNA synthetase associated domain-containing protein [Roseococcus sp. DSY-14]|uniref:prolyl-tRNA synthetase associated domain-containing protein n=1 Tax=Roseococcus sp. DSY-14 TaxID=3369650 RepID=UPI00387B7455
MSPEELLARLDALGVAHRTVSHAAVFTVAESRALRGALPGAHSKNLFLRRRDGGFALAVLEEGRQASVNALARLAGWGRVRMAGADELRATLGVEPGSVTPFGLVHAAPGSVAVLLDAALAGAGTAWFHPLVNTRSTALAGAELVRVLREWGHAPLVLGLEESL